MNRTLRHAILLAFAVSVSAAPAFAQKKDSTTFATVNGKAIPKVRADALIAGQAAQGQPDSPELRKAVTEELVRREVLTQESIKKGFDKKPEVQGQVDLARQGVLIGAYLNDYVKTHPVTDEQVKKEYDEIRAKLGKRNTRRVTSSLKRKTTPRRSSRSWRRARSSRIWPRIPRIPAPRSVAAIWVGPTPPPSCRPSPRP